LHRPGAENTREPKVTQENGERPVTDTDTAPASGYAADLDAIQALLDKARATAVPDGTRAHAVPHLDLPSPEAVDAAAAQWDTEARWTADGRQYRAEIGQPGLNLSASYHPYPLRLVTA
jgi:hypothetical protein